MKHTAQSLAKQFCQGEYVNVVDTKLWRQAFEYIARLTDDTAFSKAKIATLWAQYGGDVRAKLKNDHLALNVLKKTMPCNIGDSQTLFRGESWFLFDQNQIGFCWTTSEAIATSYAKGLNAVDSGGVLLKCTAPAEAILAIEHGVYICDPTQVLRMTTLALFPKL